MTNYETLEHYRNMLGALTRKQNMNRQSKPLPTPTGYEELTVPDPKDLACFSIQP